MSREAQSLPSNARDGLFFALMLAEERLSVAELAAQLTERRWLPSGGRPGVSVGALNDTAIWSSQWTPRRVYGRLARARRELKLRERRCRRCGGPIPRRADAWGRPADYCPKHTRGRA